MIIDSQNTISNIGDMSKVKKSCLKDISGPAEISQIEGGLKVSTNLVEYSGTSEIEGKDLNMHIAILSEPAKSLAIEYAVAEVSSNCNNKEVNLACSDYPFIFKAVWKEEEKASEEKCFGRRI